MSKFVILVTLIMSLSACGGNEMSGKEKDNQTGARNVSTAEEMSLTNNAIAKRAKQKIIKYDEINEVIAIHNDMQLIVGFNVEKMQEFNVKEIEERVKKDLKEEFGKELIMVSHDRKILMELEKLIQEEENLSEKEINQRMQQIKSLSKEVTLL
ncbi:hypothetical protein FZW96_15210 [Bacillus sp. BGMRC 2118]|nr:hypothetical protein FZW96_15210 [Bacillus sp. BGMRC 2118]